MICFHKGRLKRKTHAIYTCCKKKKKKKGCNWETKCQMLKIILQWQWIGVLKKSGHLKLWLRNPSLPFISNHIKVFLSDRKQWLVPCHERLPSDRFPHFSFVTLYESLWSPPLLGLRADMRNLFQLHIWLRCHFHRRQQWLTLAVRQDNDSLSAVLYYSCNYAYCRQKRVG